MRLKVHLATGFVSDVFFLRCGLDTKVSSLLSNASEVYDQWHKFPVYEFQMKWRLPDRPVVSKHRRKEITLAVEESESESENGEIVIDSNNELKERNGTEKKEVKEEKEGKEEKDEKEEKSFPVFDPNVSLADCFDDEKSLGSILVYDVMIEETQASVERRIEEERKAAEERRRREEEARRLEEERQKRIAELSVIGDCWELEGYSRVLDVPIDRDGLIVRNKGSLEQWAPIRAIRTVKPLGKFYFSVKIESSPETTNTWKFCVGIVPTSYKPMSERRWVGAQKSWAYIAGTGGKCHDSGKSSNYGEKYGEGDVIGCLLDYDKGTIVFYKNNISQGTAFRNLAGPVYPAVSLTATGSVVRINTKYPESMREIMDRYWQRETDLKNRWIEMCREEFVEAQREDFRLTGTNSWDASFSLQKDDSMWYPDPPGTRLLTVINNGSDDKWRSVRGIGVYEGPGVCFAEVKVLSDMKTSNSWRICIGCVPVAFRANLPRAWVGSQHSWAYIAGNGGKTYNSGQSTAYGESYSQGDKVGICMNFDTGELEFFTNGESQGVAYENLTGPVHIAASFTGTRTTLRFVEPIPNLLEQYRTKQELQLQEVKRVLKDYGNVWDELKMSDDLKLDETRTIVENTGSGNKWRCCGSLLHYSGGRRYFEILILDIGKSTNSWSVVVGAVPKSYDYHHAKLWVGAQKSWGYIGGTGGKCRDNGKSSSFGSKYGKGDRIGVLIDFDNTTIQFFKNGVSLGDAYDSVTGPVFAAVSMTGKGTKIQLVGSAENATTTREQLFLYK